MTMHASRRTLVALLLALAVVGPAPAFPRQSSDLAEDLAEELVRNALRIRVEQGLPPADGESFFATTALPAFYERRLYRPAWSGPRGPLPVARELLGILRHAGQQGLRPRDYHVETLESLMARLKGPPGPARTGSRADLDLLLTDAFLIYGAHLVSGRVNPETLDPEWIAVRREVDLVQLLEDALAAGRVGSALALLLPDHPGYGRLLAGLAAYRRLAAAGGWPEIPPGPVLKPGEAVDAAGAERLTLLRQRLIATGDLAAEAPLPADPAVFDEDLAAGVRHFQARHGLDADGVVGEKTLAALNVPAAERARQIELNLERWRWLPQDLGERYILVNIPEFNVRVMEGLSPVLVLRAIVGRPYRRTPVFSDTLRYLVFNPSWQVPPSLAVQDKLPEIRKDPEYLSKNGFRVFKGWGAEQEEIDPATVDWSRLSARHFPYRLRQEPGPANALGRVKFMFPNKFDVYLHDTPGRELFARAQRDFSSGCIRVEKPLDLAEYLLRSDPAWTRQRIEAALASGRETLVPLPETLPVHLLYWTAWGDGEGAVHFRQDIYGRDARLAAALVPPAVPVQ